MMEIEFNITSKAKDHASRLAQEMKTKVFRLYLEGKGCDGFYYGISPHQKKEDDFHCAFGDGAELVVDPATYEFVKKSTIDWVKMDGVGEGFLVTNPREKAFRGKFFKKSVWQHKLEQIKDA